MPKKIKKVSSAPPKKTKVKYYVEKNEVKKPATFQSTVVPYQVLEDSRELEKLRIESKNTEQDLSLLQKELEKPLASRNKTLLKKYASRVNESYSWPDLEGGKKYNITAFSPDSSEIKLEKRPQPWYVNIPITEIGNEFLYKFPISLFSIIDGESFYKLDETGTVIDSLGNIIDTLSDGAITPYVILKNFIDGNTSLASEYLSTDLEGNPFYYFKFPGFRVSATLKPGGKKIEKLATEPDGKPAAETEAKPKVQKITIPTDFDWGNIAADKKKLIESRLSEKGVNLTDEAHIFHKNQVVLKSVKPSFSNNSWVVLDRSTSTKGPQLTATYVEGLDHLKKLMLELAPGVPKSAFGNIESASSIVKVRNKSIAEKLAMM